MLDVSLSILPLKLDWSEMERSRLVVKCCNLSNPKAFVKMLIVCRFMLMCCRLTCSSMIHSQMKW